MLQAVAVASSAQLRTVRALRVQSRTLSASFAVGAVAAAYALVFAVAGILDYVGFRSAGYDLGNAVQAIWNTAHGRLLQSTAENGEQFSRLGWHVDPLLVLFAPLWLVWSSPMILLVVQAVAVSAGALPVFWLARKHLGSERAATCFGLAYLAYPATQWNALDPNLGFHPVSVTLPLLLYALWWLDEERWVLFGIAAVLAAASNEQIPLVVGCLGLWYGLTRKRPVVGFGLFAAGLAITAFEFVYVVPHFSISGTNPFADRYAGLGGTAGAVLKTSVLHPLKAAEVVFTGHKLGYLALLFVPLLGLCFRAPLLLVAVVPLLVINLLSSSTDQTSVWSHYAAATTAILFGATVIGAARTRDPARAAGIALAAVAVTAVLSPFWTAVPVARDAVAGSGRLSAERHAVELIPDGVPVSATNIISAHLSNRQRIMLFPNTRRAQWIVVDTADAEGPISLRAEVERARRSGAFATVYESNGVVVMRRTG
jgi:uncharacterized membrane protein